MAQWPIPPCKNNTFFFIAGHELFPPLLHTWNIRTLHKVIKMQLTHFHFLVSLRKVYPARDRGTPVSKPCRPLPLPCWSVVVGPSSPDKWLKIEQAPGGWFMMEISWGGISRYAPVNMGFDHTDTGQGDLGQAPSSASLYSHNLLGFDLGTRDMGPGVG